MIEFVLKNRKLRLHPDGIMYSRAINKFGVETKSGRIWREVKFHKNEGYMCCYITIDSVKIKFRQHRLVYYAHNQDWNIFDTSRDNFIDHYNRKRDDNSIENLHVVNHQENMWNTDAKGYYWHKTCNKWQAQIFRNGEFIYIGLFEKEEDARNAYIKKKLELHLI